MGGGKWHEQGTRKRTRSKVVCGVSQQKAQEESAPNKALQKGKDAMCL